MKTIEQSHTKHTVSFSDACRHARVAFGDNYTVRQLLIMKHRASAGCPSDKTNSILKYPLNIHFLIGPLKISDRERPRMPAIESN